MLLVVTAPVGVKQSRSSWHTAERPRQLGFAVVCTSADPGASPCRAVLWPCRCRLSGSFCLSPGGVCCRPGPGMFPEVWGLPAAQSRASPAGLRGTRCVHPVPGTEGLCRSRGCHQRLWGQRCCASQLFSAVLPAQLASHRALPGARGCRLGRITPLKCQISHPQGRSPPGCSDVPKLALSS